MEIGEGLEIPIAWSRDKPFYKKDIEKVLKLEKEAPTLIKWTPYGNRLMRERKQQLFGG